MGSPYVYQGMARLCSAGQVLKFSMHTLIAGGRSARYVPRSVNQAAFRVLDALFPMGKLSRRAVSLLFRLWLHPGAPSTRP